jgi:hypothetical protein
MDVTISRSQQHMTALPNYALKLPARPVVGYIAQAVGGRAAA